MFFNTSSWFTSPFLWCWKLLMAFAASRVQTSWPNGKEPSFAASKKEKEGKCRSSSKTENGIATSAFASKPKGSQSVQRLRTGHDTKLMAADFSMLGFLLPRKGNALNCEQTLLDVRRCLDKQHNSICSAWIQRRQALTIKLHISKHNACFDHHPIAALGITCLLLRYSSRDHAINQQQKNAACSLAAENCHQKVFITVSDSFISFAAAALEIWL